MLVLLALQQARSGTHCLQTARWMVVGRRQVEGRVQQQQQQQQQQSPPLACNRTCPTPTATPWAFAKKHKPESVRLQGRGRGGMVEAALMTGA